VEVKKKRSAADQRLHILCIGLLLNLIFKLQKESRTATQVFNQITINKIISSNGQT
jgi:hypothetical protein